MAAVKPTSQLKLLLILQDCKQIPKDDRLLLRKLIKDGDQQAIKILSDTNNKKLQVKLRKHIQKCKQNKRIQHGYENSKHNTVNSKYIAALYQQENQNNIQNKQYKQHSLSHTYNKVNQYSASKSIHKSGNGKKSLQSGKAIRDFREQLEQCRFMRPSASNTDIRQNLNFNLNIPLPPRQSNHNITNIHNNTQKEYQNKNKKQVQKQQKALSKTLKLSRNASGQLNIGTNNNDIGVNLNNFTSNTQLFDIKPLSLSNNWTFNSKYTLDHNYLKPEDNFNHLNTNINNSNNNSITNNVNNNNNNISNSNISLNNNLFTSPQLLKWDNKWQNKSNLLNNSYTNINNITNITPLNTNINNVNNIKSNYNSHNSSLSNSRIQKQSSIFTKPKQQHININLAAIDAMLRSSIQNNISANYNIFNNITNHNNNISTFNTKQDNININTNNTNNNNKQDNIYNFKCALIKYYAQDIFQYICNKYFPLTINEKSVYLPYKQFLQEIQNYLKNKGQNIQIISDTDINIPLLEPFKNQFEGASIKSIGAFVNKYCLHKNNTIRGIFIVLDSVQCMGVNIEKFNRINSWKGNELVEAFQRLVKKWGEGNAINYWQVYRVKSQKQYTQFDALYSKL